MTRVHHLMIEASDCVASHAPTASHVHYRRSCEARPAPDKDASHRSERARPGITRESGAQEYTEWTAQASNYRDRRLVR